MNSRELASLMHASGINMRYLGKVTQALTMPFFRYMVLADIASRVAKKYFRKTTQEDLRGYWAKSRREASPQEVEEYLIQQSIDFLALLTGDSVQSENMWKILSQQAKHDFGV